MNNYNIRLVELRKEKGLTIKEAAKQMKVNRFKLYFYENGYFTPSKVNLKKINEFYQVDLSVMGEDGYPAPNRVEKPIRKRKENLKGKRIAFGILSIFSLLFITAGVILFSQSVNNKDGYYGETYNNLRQSVVEQGDYGYDLVTSMQYHYVIEDGINTQASVVYYQTNNILYFNECTYSKTYFNGTWDLERFHYHFGFNLGINSYVCQFTYSSLINGSSFSCEFLYDTRLLNNIYNFKVLVYGDSDVTELFALEKANSQLPEINPVLSKLMSDTLGKDVDFYNDFLSAREQGRVVNFALQITGLILIFLGIIMFFIFFGIFMRLMLKNIRPRLVVSELDEKSDKEPLPEDLKLGFGVPDVVIVLFGKIFQYGSMVLFFAAFIASLGVPFLSFLANPQLLMIFRWSWIAGVFLEHFVMVSRIKKPDTLFKEIIYNIGLFLFIATFETVLVAITNAWGYDLSGLLYKYIPGNIYQVVAIHYFLFLFLFFEPKFLSKAKYSRVVWHCLSIIPLGLLITAYIFSNSYALMYGVKENIFINIWFPTAYLSLSTVSVLFIYITFFVRLYYEKKFGKANAHVYFLGNRYCLNENLICVILIAIMASIDLFLVHNQYASYMGLGNNYWLFALIPFILLCKYSPDSQQIFLVDESFTRMVKEEKVKNK